MTPLRLSLLALAAAACAHAAPSVPPAPRVIAPPGTDSVLRGIDWCNRRYGEPDLDLRKCSGEVAQRHRAGEGIWGFHRFHLQQVVYGDVTGDGQEDALLVFETTLRPVMIPKPTPAPRAEVWVIQRRGDDLVRYTTEVADSPPQSVAIANGEVVLTWAAGGAPCVERWRFAGVGETARKSAPSCAAP